MTANSDVSTRRRVKLYMLNDERQWDDKGTGHVSATFVDQNAMALVVISETDGSHLLESRIQHDTAYQKQQETLIVWSEGDNMDLALSFQEKTGCDDIWEKICNVQGKDPSVEITQDLIDDADDTEDIEMDASTTGNNQGFEFPPCDLSHLVEISEMFTQVINYPIQRERLATALERTQYMKQLTDLFHKAEDLEDIKSLHHLYEIMRAIIQFNRRNLYEIIFSEEYMMDVVGMLEYAPSKRVKHREFLLKKANFKEVLPMNSALKNKIHQTFRVQYIQDSCMPPPSLFDDNGGASLNSFVYLNKIDIITKLQDDTQFMTHLFNGLLSSDMVFEHRHDLLLLLKDFCTIVNSLQPAQKESFFGSLCQNRALKSIFYSFKIGNESLKCICVDILQIFVENQASVVREFFINDCRENGPESLYINILIDQLINDPDPELSNGFLIMGMLKVLLDPENMVNTAQRNEKQEFLNFLYKHSMQHLTGPLMAVTAGGSLRHDDYHTAMIMHDIVELIGFCVEFHSYHMKNYLFQHNTLVRVVSMFRSRHQSLVLAALRVVRKFVASREEFNYRYVIKNGILGQVVALLDRNRHYNMLNSAILELFEFIRNENIGCLISDVVEHHWSVLQRHDYSNVFQLLKARYDQSMERSLKSGASVGAVNMLSMMASGGSVGAVVGGGGGTGCTGGGHTKPRRLAGVLDDDEEQWYDQEDEEDADDGTVVSSQALFSSSGQTHSPVFVERNCRPGKDSQVTDSIKATIIGTSRLTSRDHIAINIKSTVTSLGTVSSSTTTTDGLSPVVVSLASSPLMPVPIDDSDKCRLVSSADIAKRGDVSVMLSGLVDYTSDDDDDDTTTTNNNGDNDDDGGGDVLTMSMCGDGGDGGGEDTSTSTSTDGSGSGAKDWSTMLSSPKRLKTE